MMNLSGIPRWLGKASRNFGDDAGNLFQHWRKNAQSLAMEIPHTLVSWNGQMTPDLDYLPKVRDFIEASTQVQYARQVLPSPNAYKNFLDLWT